MIEKIENGLIVSCQALEFEPLHSSFIMSKMALAAYEGGACGIRANSIEDIIAIKDVVDLPIIGIIKEVYSDCDVFITPTLTEIDLLVSVGVNIIAIDGTKRDRPDKMSLDELMKNVKRKYPSQLFMADVSTIEEAIICDKLGFDFIGTTLVGYTEYSKNDDPLDVLEKIVNKVNCNVIAEGNINTPEMAKKALELGAYSVVVGSMITRPQIITKKFVDKMSEFNLKANMKFFSIDIGGTAVKYGIVDSSGNILLQDQFPIKGYTDRVRLIEDIFKILDKHKNDISGIGISCTGKIDSDTGLIIGGIEIMNNWLSTPLKSIFESRYNVPTYVNNDVKCIGLGELWMGEGKRFKDFICVAFGTGIGGAVICNGNLITGVTNVAGEIGHLTLKEGGKPCKCGKNGCYERYGSMTALIERVEEATGETLNGKEIFNKCKNNEQLISNIVDDWINDIADGLCNIIQILNPEAIIIGGAVSVQKEMFVDKLILATKSKLHIEYTDRLVFKTAVNFNNAGMLGAVYGLLKNI